MNNQFNRRTATVLKKFFIKQLEQLDAKVFQELEDLRLNPIEKAIYLSLIDLHDLFSQYLGKINAFKHSPSYASMFSHWHLDQRQIILFANFELISIKLSDKLISNADALQMLTIEVNEFLFPFKYNPNGYRSKAA